jgi:hypothetical protein
MDFSCGLMAQGSRIPGEILGKFIPESMIHEAPNASRAKALGGRWGLEWQLSFHFDCCAGKHPGTLDMLRISPSDRYRQVADVHSSEIKSRSEAVSD